jgi:hypothetical protein
MAVSGDGKGKPAPIPDKEINNFQTSRFKERKTK